MNLNTTSKYMKIALAYVGVIVGAGRAPYHQQKHQAGSKRCCKRSK